MPLPKRWTPWPLACAALLAGVPSLAQSTGGGPNGGPIQFLAITGGHGENVLAIAGPAQMADQVFLSFDSGSNWNFVGDSLDSLPIVAVEVDPSDRTRVFGAILRLEPLVSYVYESRDSGLTWSLLAELPGFRVKGLVFRPQSHGQREIFAFGSRPTQCQPGPCFPPSQPEILRSSDGRSWRSSTSGLLPWSSVSAMAFDPTRPWVVFAGGEDIFRSDDGGETWATIDGGPPCDLRVLAVSPDGKAVYAGTGFATINPPGGPFCRISLWCGGVFRSDDGRNWAMTTISYAYVTDLAVQASEPDRVYASAKQVCFAQGGVFAGLNHGTSWRRTGLLPSNVIEIDDDNGALLMATDLGVFRGVIPRFLETPGNQIRRSRRSHRLW